MSVFVYSGKKKIRLNLDRLNHARYLHHATSTPQASLTHSMNTFFDTHGSRFIGNKVCVVIPDKTREFHARTLLRLLSRHLLKRAQKVEYLIALGLHRKLAKSERMDLLGESFLKQNKVIQHSLGEVKSLGRINGVPATLNRRLFSCDVLLTVGVVEPHLYAGFSGGIKSIAIGLAGKKTILHTHAVDYLSQQGVKVGKIKGNPFQIYLKEVIKKLSLPVYSLNIINDLNKKIAYCSMGEAGKSFSETAKNARQIFACPVRERFDLLLVGCDEPKDANLYQASRLFNTVLDLRPLVKAGGTICVFAGLDENRKSQAEINFEELLKGNCLSGSYAFRKPGEHRAFKVIEAAQRANLAMVTPNIPRDRFSCLTFYSTPSALLKQAAQKYGREMKTGIIPAGFSFIPTR